MKKELDIYREKGAAHPYMDNLDRNLVPFQHENMEDWRTNERYNLSSRSNRFNYYRICR